MRYRAAGTEQDKTCILSAANENVIKLFNVIATDI